MVLKKMQRTAALYAAAMLLFFGAELLVHVVRFATFPWYKNALAGLFFLLLWLAYGLCGAIAGCVLGLCAAVVPFLKKGSARFFTLLLQVMLTAGYIRQFAPAETGTGELLVLCSTAMLLAGGALLWLLPQGAHKRPQAVWWCSVVLGIDLALVGVLFVWTRYLDSLRVGLPMSLGAYGGCLAAAVAAVPAAGLWLRRRPDGGRIAAGVIGILVLAAAACLLPEKTADFGRPPALQPNDRPSVVLITMDTTRRDHLSCYGYPVATTPAVDALARDGVLFERAYSASSWTLPAHASLFTGKYPAQHGAHTRPRNVFGNDLAASNLTLAEVLSGHGYRTGGVIGGYLCSSFFGIAQGFQWYDENLLNALLEGRNFLLPDLLADAWPLEDRLERRGLAGKRIAPQINRAALGWLQHVDRGPFFLFLNYFDPHHPYIPQAPTAQPASAAQSYVAWEGGLINRVLTCQGPLAPQERRLLIERYDREIMQADAAIGEIVGFLKKTGRYDNTMIIVTADHGESFGEHGLMIHTPALYEELVRVPLIVKYPAGMPRPGRVAEPVSLTGVMPEILRVAGIPVPQDLPARGIADPDHPVMAERYRDANWQWTCHPFAERTLRVLYRGDYKLIWSSSGVHELYNVARDPAELKNIFAEKPALAGNLLQLLTTWNAAHPEVEQSGDEPVSGKVLESLKAMGYVK